MNTSKISWMDIALLIPAFGSLAYSMGASVGVSVTAGLAFLTILLLAMSALAPAKRSEPSRADYLIALSIVHRAFNRGKINRLASLKAEMFILHEIAIQPRVTHVVAHGRTLPAGWDMVEA